MRFFGVNVPYCSQVAQKCSRARISICNLLIPRGLVGASRFELETSCAQGKP